MSLLSRVLRRTFIGSDSANNRRRTGQFDRRRKGLSRRHLALEPLEDRRVLSIVTWDGGGTTNDWSEPANWSTDLLPTASDEIIFDATSTKDSVVNVEFDGTIRQLQINSGYTGAVTLARNLTVNGSFTQQVGVFDFGAGTNTVAVAGNFTVSAAATFNAREGAVEFIGWSVVDSEAAFNDVILAGNARYWATNMDVNGDLTILDVEQLYGTIDVAGNVTTYDTVLWCPDMSTIRFDGDTDQRLFAAVDEGAVLGIEIDKGGGTLTVDALDDVGATLRVGGNWNQVSGAVVINAPTVEFRWRSDVNSATPFNDVILAGYGRFRGINMDVNGDLTILDVDHLYGIIDVAGNVTTYDTHVWSPDTSIIRFDGDTNQQLFAAVDQGAVVGIESDKTGGTLTVDAVNTLKVLRDWIEKSGTVVINAPTVEFTWAGEVDSTAAFNDVVLDMSVDLKATKMGVNGNLTITSVRSIYGTVEVAGDVTTHDTEVGGGGIIAMDGSQNATLSGDGADFPNGGILINKDSAGATVTLASDVTLSSMGVTNGTLDLDGRQLTIAGGAMAVDPDGALLVHLDASALIQTDVTGAVALGGGLDVNLLGGYVPAPGDAATIVNNDGADAVVGTFTGLPEGAVFNVNGNSLQISYVGGTGNDVVLTAASAPPTLSNVAITPAVLDEGGFVTLSGDIDDPGNADSLALQVNWGDGNTETFTYPAGTTSFSETHPYTDDEPSGTSSDDYTIQLLLSDEDIGSTVQATLDWDAAADSDANAYWESTVNASDSRRWNFGAPTSPVDVTDSDFAGLSKAYHFDTGGSGATMASWQNLGLDGANPASQDASFEIIFRPDDLIGNHVLLETGGNGDGTVVKLEDAELVFRVQRFNFGGTANDNFVEIRETLDTAGVFYHFVGTIDLANNEGSIYLDGQLIATQATMLRDALLPGGNLNDWAGGDSSGLFIANSPGGAAGGNPGWSTFNGDIANVRYYRDDVLDATEAEALYSVAVADKARQTITVNNVAPTIVGLSLQVADVDENGMVFLSGEFTDPGGPDTHTVAIDWGDGSTSNATVHQGRNTFVAHHHYLDDDPTDTPSDSYTISATATDDDGGMSDPVDTTVTVNNVAPEVVELTVDRTEINENGEVLLTGTFDDPGTLDTHEVRIDWGDGTTDTVLDFTDGERSFAATHRYLDDDPTGTPSDDYTILVTVTDDDNGVSSNAPAGEFVARTSLLVNGGFEDPLVPAGTWDYFPSPAPNPPPVDPEEAIPGWTVIRGPSIELINQMYGGPAEGFQYAELDAHGWPDNDGSSAVVQDFTTVPGELYRLSFAFSPRPNVPDNHLEVLWGGAIVADLTADGTGVSSTQWEYFTYDLTAAGDVTQVEFGDRSVSDQLGTFLDDVVVARVFPDATPSVTVTVNNVNPVAADRGVPTDEDNPVTLNVLDGVTDVGTLDTHTAEPPSLTTAQGGAVTIAANGAATYDPKSQFEYLGVGQTTTDTFSYTAKDDDTGAGLATVTVTITGVNDAPTVTADNASVTVNEGDPAQNNGAFGDVDLSDNVTITASIGTITQDAGNNGAWSWSFDTTDGPDESQIVTITADDGNGGVATTTFELTVNNVAPSLDDAAFEIEENSPNGTVVGTVTGTDPGDDTLNYRIVGGTGETAFAISLDGEITVADQSQLDFETTTSFTLEVQVADEDLATGTATVTINLLNQASITGVVFVDVNQNGLYEANEPGIDGVLIELLDEFGVPVLDGEDNPITATTGDGGFYLFEDLDPGAYLLHEIQPTGVDDGPELLGSLDNDSIVANDTMQLALVREDATDYIFSELGQQVASGDTAGIGFWQNKHGQSLISQGGTALANWLTDNFGNVFGNEFVGSDGDDVASFFKDQLFKQRGKKAAGPAKVDAHFMAVTLATYFTSSRLAGNVAADFGFNVTDTGIGTKVVNVGSGGAAFGVADGADLTIMQLLLATNDLTDQPDGITGFAHIYDTNGDGVIDAAEARLRVMANVVYSAINCQGDI